MRWLLEGYSTGLTVSSFLSLSNETTWYGQRVGSHELKILSVFVCNAVRNASAKEIPSWKGGRVYLEDFPPLSWITSSSCLRVEPDRSRDPGTGMFGVEVAAGADMVRNPFFWIVERTMKAGVCIVANYKKKATLVFWTVWL